MTTYTWGCLNQIRNYPDVELVMSVTQIVKKPWFHCYRCGDHHVHKYYSVVTVDNIVSEVCKTCLGELGLLRLRYREYLLISRMDAKIKIYQRRGLLYYNIMYDIVTCVKL